MDDITRYKRNYHYDSYIHFLRRLSIKSKCLDQVGECNNLVLAFWKSVTLVSFGSQIEWLLMGGNGHCRNLPFGGRATWGSRVRLPREEGMQSRHQRLFEENVRKTKTCGLRTLIVKGSGVVFTHGEGISTPHVRHKGRQPLIKCARHDFKIYVFFPFLCLFVLLCFLCFLYFFFLWPTRVFPSLLRILNCDEEIRPT